MKFLCYLTTFTCVCAIFVTSDDTSSSCITPNGEKGSCVLLSECKHLLSSFASNDPDVVKFVQASSCGSFKVCCGTSTTFVQKPNKPESSSESKKNGSLSTEEERDYVLKNFLPSRKVCGLQHTDDYFYNSDLYNSTITSVDEFPWLVYRPIRNDDESELTSTGCVGVLINRRYFLTSTDCKASYGYIDSVLIGQHRIYEDDSCIETPYGDDCTKPENYVLEESKENFGLALVRLSKPVTYSDFVRPICLPIEESETPQAGDILFTSGWGSEEHADGKDRKIKKRVQHVLMDKRECEKGNPISDPICALTLQNNTNNACPEDNGGPLMYYHAKKPQHWIVLGIVTGKTSCAKYKPIVARRITPEIVNWILDNIQP